MTESQPSLRLGVVCYPSVGGSGVVATEIAIRAARAGHDVHLLSFGRPARLESAVPGLRYHEVQVSAYPLFRYPPYDLALATRMAEVHEEARVDLWHVHYAIPHAVSAWLARSMGGRDLRFVTTLHGTDITVVGVDRAYARPTRFALDQSNAVTAVSQFLADETVIAFGSRRAIEVVPNFVDVDLFAPSGGQRFAGRDGGERWIVHASNFRPIKRVGDTVRAFAKIAAKLPARLLLAGDGPDRDHALAVAVDLGIADRVESLGVKNQVELARLLADADLFLSSSESESFGLSMLEAMSCGVPCVSTRVGGVAEVFGDTGRLVPLGDSDAMARAGIELLADPVRHAAASHAARDRAVTAFRAEDVMKRYLALYRRVIAA
ncbi:MAG: N-acetyl-alpha-D-glucosaminyl L-malate synthase BshA [Planctomycetota bacterium]